MKLKQLLDIIDRQQDIKIYKNHKYIYAGTKTESFWSEETCKREKWYYKLDKLYEKEVWYITISIDDMRRPRIEITLEGRIK